MRVGSGTYLVQKSITLKYIRNIMKTCINWITWITTRTGNSGDTESQINLAMEVLAMIIIIIVKNALPYTMVKSWISTVISQDKIKDRCCA